MEKPLHVRVAEALGARVFKTTKEWARAGSPTDGHIWIVEQGDERRIPRYDTDWSATGPLIERFHITLLHLWRDGDWEAMEDARTGHDGELWNERGVGSLPGPGDYKPPQPASGPTPLIAVCNLILDLHAAGRLKVA